MEVGRMEVPSESRYGPIGKPGKLCFRDVPLEVSLCRGTSRAPGSRDDQ
jgi:hypothetical protein